MNRQSSLLHQLLGTAIILAVSAWLISWAVALLTPLAPLGIGLLVLVGLGLAVRGVINRGRYW